MLFHVLHSTKEPRNTGWELLCHLLAYKGIKGKLWVGGLIAHIATHFQVDLSQYTPTPPAFLDQEYLMTTKIVSLGIDGSVVATFEGHVSALTTRRMDIYDWPNWFQVWSRRSLPTELMVGAGQETDKPRPTTGRPWGEEEPQGNDEDAGAAMEEDEP